MNADRARLAAVFGADAVDVFPSEAFLPAGFESLPVVSPPTLDAACEVLRFATCERLRVLPAGAGEHLHRATARPTDVDFVLSARALRRIVEFEPEDMVLVAEAGLPLRELDAVACASGQRLGPSLPFGRAATVGGAVAAHRSGIDRLGRGTVRDALLGARVVHADGRTSKTGGRVVKNVAGYDTGKLYVGSRGALAFLAEVNLRLVARPEGQAWIVAPLERARAAAMLLEVHRGPFAPMALVLLAGDARRLAVPPGEADDAATPATGSRADHVPAPVVCAALFEGHASAVQAQADALRGRFGSGRAADAGQQADLTAALHAWIEPRPGSVLLRIATRPTGSVDVLGALETLPCWEKGSGWLGLYGAGIGWAHLQSPQPRELRVLAARVAALGGGIEAECATHAVPVRDAEPLLEELLAATKRALDPGGVLPPIGVRGGR